MKITLSLFSLFILSMSGSTLTAQLPLVNHKHYNISFWGLDKLHPFDSKKYGKVYDYLVSKVGIDPKSFHVPKKVRSEDLLKVHTKEYLASLTSSSTLAKIAEIPILGWVPNFLLQRNLLDPMRYATQGTIDAAFLSLEHGWAINLSGGYHHAKAGNGEGFCVYADIPLAIYKIHEKYPSYKVLIVDLDAHQGNGHEMICGTDSRVTIFYVYNKDVYPQDRTAQQHITYNYPVQSYIEDDEYLAIVLEGLSKVLQDAQPDVIIYNAGTDILAGDKLGRMSITQEGIIQRDALVFTVARDAHIPITMVLSGGYTKESSSIISLSIENILTNIVHATNNVQNNRQQNKHRAPLKAVVFGCILSSIGLYSVYNYFFKK